MSGQSILASDAYFLAGFMWWYGTAFGAFVGVAAYKIVKMISDIAGGNRP